MSLNFFSSKPTLFENYLTPNLSETEMTLLLFIIYLFPNQLLENNY
jgi:hypothetical protein